jgi:putative tryptophan/tyrosine transport system substrate-binding protein
MKRRKFIALVGGVTAWPLAARAQQPALPVVGYLSIGTPRFDAVRLAAFQKGLSEAGFVEGQNLKAEYRWAENDNNRLSVLADKAATSRVSVTWQVSW